MISKNCWIFSVLLTCLLVAGLRGSSSAQVDNRVPFKHRVGNPAPEGNLFRTRGDFTIIGNTSLTLAHYDDTTGNSLDEMTFVDVDKDPLTFNSSSANLMFSQENDADPSCSEVLYAGLYWSGRGEIGGGMVFDWTKGILSGDPEKIDPVVQDLYQSEELHYTSYTLGVNEEYDGAYQLYPVYTLYTEIENDVIQFRFTNNQEVEYAVGYGDWVSVEDLKVTNLAGVTTAMFKPILFVERGMTISIERLSRTAGLSYDDFNRSLNSIRVNTFGVYTPVSPHTISFDKRKVKLKGPGANTYTEIKAAGNSILFPQGELNEMYVGYADVTDYVKSHGAGEYTVANMALAEGWGDAAGFYGHWGLVVVYQNPKMHWRDVTIFDGYSYVQSLDQQEYVGEIEIEGFGAVKQGPVDVKLGLMAGEGDRSIEGDFMEILNQKGVWVSLEHPLTSKSNFFNSSIYTPVRNKAGGLVENPRNPRLLNNTGIDIVQWDIPNPGNTIIANEQTSTRFRFGSKQDVYNIYAFAFSVRSYAPDIQVLNKIQSIANEAPGEAPVVKPGEEITYDLEIRNHGEEAAEQSRLVIPIPHTAHFVDVQIVPEGYGKVTFDPNEGFAGALIWEIGEIPLLADRDEVVATLRYTLKVTEDCFVLANDNCEPTLEISGSISGVGSISESVFSNIPFGQRSSGGACSTEKGDTSFEIPIIGRAAFAQSACAGYQLFSGLGEIKLPEFCQRDTPADLLSLISPSREDFTVYFFTEETGGSPLFNYYVNTGVVGSEQIWVSEGPAGSCTGFRVPVSITVVPTSPSPSVYDMALCSSSDIVDYGVFYTEGFQPIFYLDNDPLSKPLAASPQVDLSVAGEYSVWVSQFKDGECESARNEVKIIVEDCPSIKVSITPSVNSYHSEHQVITYTVVVENTGKIPLINVEVEEYLSTSSWMIPALRPAEKKTFTATYIITSDDMLYKLVSNSVYAEATDNLGTYISDYKSVEIVALTPGFLDYAVSVVDIKCGAGEHGLGLLTVDFQKGAQTGGYELQKLDDGQLFSGYFDGKKSVNIELPAGEYSLSLYENGAFPYGDPATYTIVTSQSVSFTVPEEITACSSYDFYPTTEEALIFTLRGPAGSTVGLQAAGFYELNLSGTYTVTGTDPLGIRCPVQKSFLATISQPSDLQVEILPFCSGDLFTTVQLVHDPAGYLVKWYKSEADGDIHLTEYDSGTILTVQEEGEYKVTLTDPAGCIRSKGRVNVTRPLPIYPQMDPLYTICPTNSSRTPLSAGSQFVASRWFLEGVEVSSSSSFIPDRAGSYSLIATDQNGCESFADFEVEVKCAPTVRYPTAIRPGVADKLFVVYPDNLIQELEVLIQNRWGEAIYHCKDNNLEFGQPSRCFWNGTLGNKPVPNGSYVVTIRYLTKEAGLLVTERGVVTVVE